MRRKFYTKNDYQYVPSVGTKQTTNGHSVPMYKVRIPTQLRLEPWDYDFTLPNIHGIQLDYVQPPGGNYDEDEMNAAFEQRGAMADAGEEIAEVMEVEQGRGQRRGRADANMNPDLVDRVGAVRRQRIADERPRAPRGPRTPGLAAEAARTSQNSALRVARARRNLDIQEFQREAQVVRDRNQMRYNPPAGLRGGLPPRKRPAEP